MKIDDKKLRELEKKVLAYRFRDKDSSDRKTYDEVFDHDTLLTIYNLTTKGFFDTLDFPIATGKEGNVFRATTHDGDFVAVKIYRVNNATFNHIQKYISGDVRFRGVGKNRRRTIHLWAQKEFRNLDRMHSNGIPVPKPITCQKNVIVMEFIGTDGSPAPHLRSVEIEEPSELFDALYEDLKKIYLDAKLVHADFSEYNILMTEAGYTIIDVGQAVLTTHPMTREFLERDLKNLARYFKRLGIQADEKVMFEDLKEAKNALREDSKR